MNAYWLPGIGNMPGRWDVDLEILRAYSPNKGNKMNDVAIVADPIVEANKHYVLTIDPETGKEVKVEVLPIEGEFSQEIEEETPTVH